jgi:carboxymethylenebutenolidase
MQRSARSPVSRRAFGGLMFAGYAAFFGSARGAIVTDDSGLTVRQFRFQVAGGTLPAYLAAPGSARARPTLFVISEIWGLHAYIADICRRLAKQGFTAIAPDLFARAGNPASLTSIAAIEPIVASATYRQVTGDLRSLLAHLAQGHEPECDHRNVGITGFCWGGQVVWMACAELNRLKAGVAWYGRLAPPAPENLLFRDTRPWPVDVAARLRSPVLGLYAETDDAIPLADVERMRAALARGDGRSSIHVYLGAKHGFHADYREDYDPVAARDGWGRMLGFFAAHDLYTER